MERTRWRKIVVVAFTSPPRYGLRLSSLPTHRKYKFCKILAYKYTYVKIIYFKML